MRYAAALFACLVVPTVLFAAKPLQVFFIDVEGGQSTLIVTPSHQSLLIDTGWRGYNGRDADRIVAAAKKAGIKELDYVLITHFHRDHVGGVPQLADRIKIGTFVDHGPNMEDSRVTREDYADYVKTLPKALKGHIVAKVGDKIPLKGVDVQVVSSNGDTLKSPFEGAPGAGQPNPLCSTAKQHEVDTSENARSLGTVLTYGKFRMIDLGDLTWNKELQLVCPNNLLGTVDVYVVSHHGTNLSGSPQFVHGIHPRVAIMGNGARKGGNADTWQIVRSSPGLEDIWQLHFAVEGGKQNNAPDTFIANLYEKGDEGKGILLTAEPDGSFTVLNARNKYRKSYPAK